MIKTKSILLLFLLLITIKTNSQNCFEIESILVDACGTPEGVNEMVRFKIGNTSLNTSSLSVQWPVQSGNLWLGLCQNATSASKVSFLNSTITSCGFIKEPISGVLPANSTVIIVTSDTFNALNNSFANLSDTIYMIFQCRGNIAGHFVNFNTTPNTIRTLKMNFGTSCVDSVSYDANLLVNQQGLAINSSSAGRDGSSVAYTTNGTPTYYNNGCQAPIDIFSINIESVSYNSFTTKTKE